jgi:SAM-dependent methyltransferase
MRCMITPRPPAEVYGAGLLAAAAGSAAGWQVRHADGHARPLPLADWCGGLRPGDAGLLDRCRAATLDVGCGPGRLVEALSLRGVPALGVDIAPDAVALSRARGGSALRRDVFAALPGEGRWRQVLLVDGNVGIGGDPVALLRRCAALLHPLGTVLCEAEPPGRPLRRTPIRLEHADGRRSHWFRWAYLGLDALAAAAPAAGAAVVDSWAEAGRWFATLRRR